MSFSLQYALKESLVLLFEVLRKVEMRFAVALFGSRDKTRIVKRLEDSFSSELGEKILESLTFDQGTYLATALGSAMKLVFEGPKYVYKIISLSYTL